MPGTIEVLDPVGVNKAPRLAPSPRVPDLSGKVVGLLDNGKPNFELLLGRVEEILTQRYQVAGVVRRRKPTVMAAAPRELIQELAERSDLVINGLGD